jgi:5-formyltetrahydrofolate cyclo-ligase
MERATAPDQPVAPAPDAPKPEWRRWARQLRSALDPAEVGREVARSLAAWPTYRSARRVLVYLAFGSEPDLSPLLADRAKSFYTTRSHHEEPVLSLHRLDPESLERHRFGFLQPAMTAAAAPAAEIEIVLVPGLAFDAGGNRLGFGMGYYDRLLATLEPGVPRVGVTPAALLVPRLPSEEHDVRMTHLATEDGVFPVG